MTWLSDDSLRTAFGDATIGCTTKVSYGTVTINGTPPSDSLQQIGRGPAGISKGKIMALGASGTTLSGRFAMQSLGTTVAYVGNWLGMASAGEYWSTCFPPEWQSADGTKLWATFSCHNAKSAGDIACRQYHDRLSIMQATLTPVGSGGNNGGFTTTAPPDDWPVAMTRAEFAIRLLSLVGEATDRPGQRLDDRSAPGPGPGAAVDPPERVRRDRARSNLLGAYRPSACSRPSSSAHCEKALESFHADCR